MSVLAPDRTGPAAAAPRRIGAAERLARWSTRHRWKALVLWLLLVVGAVVGGGAAGTRTLDRRRHRRRRVRSRRPGPREGRLPGRPHRAGARPGTGGPAARPPPTSATSRASCATRLTRTARRRPGSATAGALRRRAVGRATGPARRGRQDRHRRRGRRGHARPVGRRRHGRRRQGPPGPDGRRGRRCVDQQRHQRHGRRRLQAGRDAQPADHPRHPAAHLRGAVRRRRAAAARAVRRRHGDRAGRAGLARLAGQRHPQQRHPADRHGGRRRLLAVLRAPYPRGAGPRCEPAGGDRHRGCDQRPRGRRLRASRSSWRWPACSSRATRSSARWRSARCSSSRWRCSGR